MCPENSKVPLVLFERLMKIYFKTEEWAQKVIELEGCTILTIEQDTPKACHMRHKYLKVHRLHQQAMLKVIYRHLPAGMYKLHRTESHNNIICITLLTRQIKQ